LQARLLGSRRGVLPWLKVKLSKAQRLKYDSSWQYGVKESNGGW
jgi:hypothetical protein